MTLWAVVAAASVRFHIRLVAGGVDAFLGQANHAFTDLSNVVNSCSLMISVGPSTYIYNLSVGGGRLELKEDDVEDRHLGVVVASVWYSRAVNCIFSIVNTDDVSF